MPSPHPGPIVRSLHVAATPSPAFGHDHDDRDVGGAGHGLRHVRGRTPAHRDDHHRPEDRHGETQGRPDGANYDSFEGSNVYLTAAFADLPGPKKQAVAQEAAYAFQDGLTPKEKAKIENTCSGTPVNVLDHLGRLVYTMHPCHQDFKGLTEHQRDVSKYSYWPQIHTSPRANHPLRAGVREADVKKAFQGVMGWKPAYFIAWVPEGGVFEINLATRAEVARLAGFWPKAPKGYRYEVLLNDGTRIAQKHL